eukprot:3459864-Amphidinium_carterae.1
MDPFADLEPLRSPFSMSNVSINLGAATNDANQQREQRVVQTSDLGTQDAFHVVSREYYTAVTGSEQQPVTSRLLRRQDSVERRIQRFLRTKA